MIEVTSMPAVLFVKIFDVWIVDVILSNNLRLARVKLRLLKCYFTVYLERTAVRII